ncbi:hypothetical protein BH23CHL1_BH23CHL1_02590 [soil metagenome]
MPMTGTERTETLAEMARGYHELTELLDSLDSSDLERPNTVGHWSGKDVLSHIAAWEVEATRFVGTHNAGTDEPLIDESQFDAFNEENVSRTRDWTLAQVRAYVESAHLDFVNACRNSPTVTPGFATGLSSHHYDEHMGQFRGMRSKSGT